jgi:hypothetical protein
VGTVAGVLTLLVIAVVGIPLNALVLQLVGRLTGVFGGFLAGRNSARAFALAWLSPIEVLGWLCFILWVPVAGVTILALWQQWGVADGAVTLNGWLIGGAYLLVAIGGIGSGAAEAGNREVLRQSGFTEEQANVLARLGARPGMSDEERRRLVARLREAGREDIAEALAQQDAI